METDPQKPRTMGIGISAFVFWFAIISLAVGIILRIFPVQGLNATYLMAVVIPLSAVCAFVIKRRSDRQVR